MNVTHTISEQIDLTVLGFGQIADGIIVVLTLGWARPSFALNAARRLSMHRMRKMQWKSQLIDKTN